MSTFVIMKTKIFTLLLVSALVFFACQSGDQKNTIPESEESKIINSLMAECKDFDTNTFAQALIGEWDLDSQLYYDDAWLEIEECHKLVGMWQPGYNIGVPEIQRYTFTSDGKGVYYIYSPELGSKLTEISIHFDWQYNVENCELALDGEYYSQYISPYPINYTAQFKVSGFNSEYLVLDWVTAEGNLRKIYKRSGVYL